MPISWILDGEKRLVYVTLTAPYTRDQGRAAVKAMTAHPEFASRFGFVVELIGSGDTAVVRDVFYFLATHKETFRNARIAIVITLGSRGPGIPPLPEMLAGCPELPMPARVFGTYREAERWIAQGD